jgi:transcriptional regulator with XRE-family HTH domain
MNNEQHIKVSFYQNVGRNMEELRNDYGYKAEVLASKLGVAKQTYYEYERGDKKISFDKLCILADLYQVSTHFFATKNLLKQDKIHLDCYTMGKSERIIEADKIVFENPLNNSLFCYQMKSGEIIMFERTQEFIYDIDKLMMFEYMGEKIISRVTRYEDPFNNKNVMYGFRRTPTAKELTYVMNIKDLIFMGYEINIIKHVSYVPNVFQHRESEQTSADDEFSN